MVQVLNTIFHQCYPVKCMSTAQKDSPREGQQQQSRHFLRVPSHG